MMEPLEIRATLRGGLIVPPHGIAIDALLAFAVALRDRLPPPAHSGEVSPIEIPVQRSECGRYHLATVVMPKIEERALRYMNRRPVIAEAQALGSGIKSIQISGGPSKGYRVPTEMGWVESDTLTWWCVGDKEQIDGLLGLVRYIGRRRAVGNGHVGEWTVERCEPWGDRFPVVRAGRALRPLPVDLVGHLHPRRLGRLTYPYWAHEDRQLVACP